MCFWEVSTNSRSSSISWIPWTHSKCGLTSKCQANEDMGFPGKSLSNLSNPFHSHQEKSDYSSPMDGFLASMILRENKREIFKSEAESREQKSRSITRHSRQHNELPFALLNFGYYFYCLSMQNQDRFFSLDWLISI